ncbi:hypothetical protein INT43_001593 [Umbelopsis isabellina]|uniref:Peptidase S9 prolyl oligopeptidase catalytic domain-containing protein n=1 Tax=Mortierella isabellina TaxID=91625 RepID=A0A8H7UEK7_MORIS|nr:hypothetical protein INT43_001593 [Umbelopsis isabellina]
MVETKPFGSWTSPITADSLSKQSALKFDLKIQYDKSSGKVYWTSAAGQEGGKVQIFSRNADGSGKVNEILPAGYNCRTQVHEYGGSAYSVKNNVVYFSNFSDKRLYKIDLANPSDIIPIVPENPLLRYGDMSIDEQQRFLVCIREEHFENETPKDVINKLVVINLQTDKLDQAVQVIAEGCDFYAHARLNKDSTKLTYISWDHPNMPWDSTRLNLADISFEHSFQITNDKVIVGDKIEESLMQPVWASDNTLYVISDRSGFWQIYKYQDSDIQLLLPKALEQEFGGPGWVLGDVDYNVIPSEPSKLICMDKSDLAILDAAAGTLTKLPSPFRGVSFFDVAEYNGKQYAVFAATSAYKDAAIVSYDIKEQKVVCHLKESTAEPVDEAYVSVAEEIQFPTKSGGIAYAYYYPPKNPNFQGEGLPPLKVLSHGGPTSNCSGTYSVAYFYWTSRGFAIVDVNYGGSSGYGREYRNRLHKNWGIVDVDDCCDAALYLAEKGYVDREKLTIKGGSAGGYTTLASLTFRPDVFKAGCSLFGISDMALLAEESHKFESRYIVKLVGEYPEEEALFRERSPIHFVNNIKCPVILFQGEDDKVVPPSQAEVMVKAMNENKVPNAYVLYQGEGHGFRKPENVVRTLELELWFYGQIFGFPVEGIEGVEISNWP